jgi:hypothetical protein
MKLIRLSCESYAKIGEDILEEPRKTMKKHSMLLSDTLFPSDEKGSEEAGGSSETPSPDRQLHDVTFFIVTAARTSNSIQKCARTIQLADDCKVRERQLCRISDVSVCQNRPAANTGS